MRVAFDHIQGEHGATSAKANSRVVFIKQLDKEFKNDEQQIVLTKSQVEMILKAMNEEKA